MFLLLLCLWVAFNGQINLEIILIGCIVSGLLFFFCCKFLDFSISKDLVAAKELPLVIKYALNLIVEVIKAAFVTTKFIFSKGQPSPVLINFHSGLKSETARVLLANSITLTPGTITVDLKSDMFTVHCLDKSLGEGIEECSFVNQLRRMEEVAGL